MSDLDSEEKYTQAKSLYFQHTPISEIALKTGIPRTTLQSRIKSRWEKERELQEKEFLKDMANQKKEAYQKIVDYGAIALARCVESVAKTPNPPEPKEGVMIMKIMEGLSKIMASDREANILDAFNLDGESLDSPVIDPLSIPKKEEEDDKEDI